MLCTGYESLSYFMSKKISVNTSSLQTCTIYIYAKEDTALNVEVRSSNGTTLVPIESRIFSHRTIILEGEICEKTAIDFAEKVLDLNLEDETKPITVLINSPGGSVDDGLLIYDVIHSSKAKIRLICLGKAYSMAAVLLSAGTAGRYILPHSKTMLHEPLLSKGIAGNCSSIRSISDSMMMTKSLINGLLAKHTGKTEEEIEQATSYDHFMSAEESVDFGLCDGIIEFNEIMEVMK